MIAASARLLGHARNCFVGVGLPNIVCNLAQRTVAADLQLIYESGVYGARPERLPLSIGDPTLATGATAIVSMYELFAYYLQRGHVDAAFLGGAQIDHRTLEDRPQSPLPPAVVGDEPHIKGAEAYAPTGAESRIETSGVGPTPGQAYPWAVLWRTG